MRSCTFSRFEFKFSRILRVHPIPRVSYYFIIALDAKKRDIANFLSDRTEAQLSLLLFFFGNTSCYEILRIIWASPITNMQVCCGIWAGTLLWCFFNFCSVWWKKVAKPRIKNSTQFSKFFFTNLDDCEELLKKKKNFGNFFFLQKNAQNCKTWNSRMRGQFFTFLH